MRFGYGYRESWTLQGPFEQYVIIRGWELRPGEKAHRVPGLLVIQELERWLSGGSSARVLLDMYGALAEGARSGVLVSEHARPGASIKAYLEEAFRGGRLVALRVPRPRYDLRPARKVTPEAVAPEPEEAPATAWIALRLEDEDGKPLAGVRYRLKLSDGSVREGVSPQSGVVRYEGVPAGSCTVEFPGTDGGDWKAA